MLTRGKKGLLILLTASLFVASVVVSATAQTRRRKPAAKTPVAPTESPSPDVSTETKVVDPGPKKNERPSSSSGGEVPRSDAQKPASSDVTYRYEFAQPNFEISKIVIEHDDAGRGTITFTKKMFDDTESDPLQVSEAAMTRINAAYAALNFIDSNENYQYEKDFSHLGVMTFSLKKAGKQRTAVFNYTSNKDARILADEYRKLGNQFIWIFDMSVARQNQPLQSPRLLDNLDGLIRRKEISDAWQMLPLLKDLSNDERVPLIARNHAQRLVDTIAKTKK